MWKLRESTQLAPPGSASRSQQIAGEGVRGLWKPQYSRSREESRVQSEHCISSQSLVFIFSFSFTEPGFKDNTLLRQEHPMWKKLPKSLSISGISGRDVGIYGAETHTFCFSLLTLPLGLPHDGTEAPSPGEIPAVPENRHTWLKSAGQHPCLFPHLPDIRTQTQIQSPKVYKNREIKGLFCCQKIRKISLAQENVREAKEWRNLKKMIPQNCPAAVHTLDCHRVWTQEISGRSVKAFESMSVWIHSPRVGGNLAKEESMAHGLLSMTRHVLNNTLRAIT